MAPQTAFRMCGRQPQRASAAEAEQHVAAVPAKPCGGGLYNANAGADSMTDSLPFLKGKQAAAIATAHEDVAVAQQSSVNNQDHNQILDTPDRRSRRRQWRRRMRTWRAHMQTRRLQPLTWRQ